jgi:hypothetical protein
MSEKNDDTQTQIIQKLYIKDSSFESPNTPEVFKGAEWKPKTDLNLSSSHVPFEDDTHEVTLTVTVEAKDSKGTCELLKLRSVFGFHSAPLNTSGVLGDSKDESFMYNFWIIIMRLLLQLLLKQKTMTKQYLSQK